MCPSTFLRNDFGFAPISSSKFSDAVRYSNIMSDIPQFWRSSSVGFFGGISFLQELQIVSNRSWTQIGLFVMSLQWTLSSCPSTCATSSKRWIWSQETQNNLSKPHYSNVTNQGNIPGLRGFLSNFLNNNALHCLLCYSRNMK